MDNILIRFYNQNRQWFWIVIGTIIASIILIHILNNFVKEENIVNENKLQTAEKQEEIEKNYLVVSKKQLKTDNAKIIDNFLNYCNMGDVENAYSLLSDNCKEILYPTIESFTKNYYNKIFSKKKSYTYQAMIQNKNLYTYQINFIDDILETGKLSNSSLVDYYTIVAEEDGNKLNINKFIEKKKIPYAVENNLIETKLEYIIIYYDCEVYSFKFKNMGYSEIVLDSFENPRGIFLEDENGKMYSWENYKYAKDELVLNKGVERNIDIKFNKEYSPTSSIKNIVFQNVIVNNVNKTSIKISI